MKNPQFSYKLRFFNARRFRFLVKVRYMWYNISAGEVCLEGSEFNSSELFCCAGKS